MRYGYDKLDLLGVRYDAELELRAKHETAKEVADYWKVNCTDDDFFENCIVDICNRLNVEEGPIPDEVYEIWNIIEKEYI